MAEINDILVVLSDLAKRNYFIPSYQRGYRWEKQQVTELLDDIWDFAETKQDQDYYCLQPIVVRKMSNDMVVQYELSSETGGNWYEVIDGQQRLTTIALVFQYFNEHFNGRTKDPVPNIKYETRETCIRNVYIDDGNDKACCDGKDPMTNIDLWHVVNSYQYIHDWFTKYRDQGLDEDKVKSVFKKYVKVIWYEVAEGINGFTDPIELFTRINMGKIPLTNAELIKALFLRRRNFDNNKELRQIEIAKEWDSMEYALQNDDFWYFLNKEGQDKPARIEYIFDMMYQKELELAQNAGTLESFNKQHGTDDYKTFRFFAKHFKDNRGDAVKECWEEVKNSFAALKEWFDDPVYYHYIGYLITSGVSIVDVYTMYYDSPKDEFIRKVKERIRDVVKDVTYTEENGYVSFSLNYLNHRDLIRTLLLLFNIQYIINHNSRAEHWYIRFPFELYKKQRWDIEHINSYTTYEITKGEDQVKWIETALNDLLNLGIDVREKDAALYSEIEKFRLNTSNALFPNIKAKIAKLAGEDVDEEEEVKNNIGNLTLLNAEINRGYGNSLFVSKRKEIINKDKAGCFIPICTKNIFLKYYDTEGASKTIWSKANGDHAKYLMEIKETLKDFITNDEAE